MSETARIIGEELLGWTHAAEEDHDLRSCHIVWRDEGGHKQCNEFKPHVDTYHWRWVERAIEERGLIAAFIKEFLAMASPDAQPFNSAIELGLGRDVPQFPNNKFEYDGVAYIWLWMTAPLRIRCQAIANVLAKEKVAKIAEVA